MARRIERVSVFTRNHRHFLDEAVSRNDSRPERFTTFRSSKRWAGAHSANVAHGTLSIFLAAIGGENVIEYTANLHQVHLEPDPNDPITKEVLACELEETRKEGLWQQYGIKVKTLYVISHCRKLTSPFSITKLIKASDGAPISQDYGYSYCLVREFDTLPDDFEVYPNEVSQPNLYAEGTTKKVSVNVYERSSAARKECVAHYGYTCDVCGFDFEATYGEIGKGFIHVHHLESLSEVKRNYRVDPIRDLRPVCPNCHAMLHRGDAPITIDDLQCHIRQGKKSP